jgi:uncharacterized delta-60 repeat protein
MSAKTLIANGTLILILFAALHSFAATPTIEWSAAGYAASENAGSIAVRMVRRGDLSGTSLIQFAATNGTAVNGLDYTAQTGTVVFAAGGSNQTINISLLDNSSPQANRFFNLSLFNPSNAVLALQTNAVVTLLDDESAGVLDPWFDAGIGANNDVFTLALTSEGRIIVGGQFSRFNNLTAWANLAVLLPDGRLDPNFNPTNNTPGGPVYAAAAQADGAILIGGDFVIIGGALWPYLARMKPGGGVDTNFVPAAINNGLRALIIQPDGKILIAGRFTQVGGQPRNRIARLSADGSLDTSFAPVSGADNSIRGMALQPDGRLLIGGQFSTFDGAGRAGIARLMPDGTLDLSFEPGTGTDEEVRSVAVQTDGKILIGGDFENYNGALRSSVARLFSNGTLDPDFDQGVSDGDFVRVVAPAPGGKVWTGGSFGTAGGAARHNLALLGPNGLADPFTADTDFEVFSILAQPDGQILVAGDFNSIAGLSAGRIARLNTGGAGPRIQFTANMLLANEPAGQAIAMVTRRGDYSVAAQADFVTRSGTAMPGMDYLSVTGAITFAPFETSKIIGVPIINDSLAETNETFFLALTNPASPATLAGITNATITIQDDDTGFEFSADTFASSEPEGTATITVRRGGTGSDTVSVDFIVSSGTAAAGSDFVANNGTLIFQPGETQKTFSVSIIADVLTEGTENALLVLTNASVNATLSPRRNAMLIIDDVDSVFSWGSYYLGGEADGYASIVIQRTGNRHLPASVDFIFSQGTAINGIDFVGNNGTFSLAPGDSYGQSFGFFTVPILNDGLVEGTESFLIHLANATGGASIGLNSNLIATIRDNDAGIAFTETNIVVSENSPSVTLTVRRFDDGNEPFIVEYFTSNVTAVAGLNYQSQTGTLAIPAATRTNTVTIPLIDQCGFTNDRIFTVALRNPSAGGALGSNSVVTVVIRGNDRPGGKDPSLFPLAAPGPISLSVLPSGRILGAWPTGYGFYHDFFFAFSVIELNEDGSIDPSFSPEFPSGYLLFSLCVQRDGRVLAGGVSAYDTTPLIWRLNSSGDRDLSFGGPTNFFVGTNSANYLLDVPCLIEQPDGRILVGRDSQTDLQPFPPRHPGIMRLNSNGSFDQTFNAGTGAQYLSYRSGVQAMALQPDGRILVGGLFTNFSGYPRQGLVRLDTNGVVEVGFVPYGGTRQLNVSEIKLQSDGKILIVGAFSNLFGTTISGLARLFTNGLIDTAFNPMPITGGTVRRILVQPNGRIVIGGNFTSVQGFARSGLARLEANGALDATFDPAPDQYNVTALALQPDGRILVSDADTGLWRVEGDPIPRVREWSRTNGAVRLHLNSRPGKQYVLEASTNLLHWIPVQTNTATDCNLLFIETTDSLPQQFFRAVQLLP